MNTWKQLALCACCAGTLFGQRTMYNKDLDKQGQDAATASRKIASEPIATKELQNLSTVEKQEIDGALKDGYLTMRTQIEAFSTWENVSRSVCKTLRQMYADDELAAILINVRASDHAAFDPTCTLPALTAEGKAHQGKLSALNAARAGTSASRLKTATGELAAKAEELKTTAAEAPPSRNAGKSKAGATGTTPEDATKAWVASAVSRISDTTELLQLAAKLETEAGIAPANRKPDPTKALGEIEKGIQEVGALVESAQRIWSTYRGISVDPRSLVPSKDKLAASLLAIDADRIKELAAIRAANAMYLEDTRIRLEDCVEEMTKANLWFSKGDIEDTLQKSLSKDDRFRILYSLHLASAGAVVNQTPISIQALRESIVQRRHDIRVDSVYNGAYEQALQGAGQRLAAYYGAGFKPTDIASFLYYLSGLVSLPKLAF